MICIFMRTGAGRAFLAVRAGRAGSAGLAVPAGMPVLPRRSLRPNKQTNKQTDKRLGGRRCLSRCAAPQSPIAGFRGGTPWRTKKYPKHTLIAIIGTLIAIIGTP